MRTRKHIWLGALTVCTISMGTRGDSCGTWEVIETPAMDTATQAFIRDVAAIAPDDVWAVGGFTARVSGQSLSYAFSMHWDGSTWSFVPTPNPTECPTCTNVTLWAVDATGPSDVWAAGAKRVRSPDGFLGTHILVMHWEGSQWTVMDTPIQSGASGDMVWGVEAIAPNDVWFFGEGFYGGSPLIPDPALAMHWNGSNFQLTSVPGVNPQTSGFGDGNALRDGSALASNDLWAVGAASDGDSMPSIHSQIQHWNGSVWTPVPAGTMPGYWYDLNAVVAIAPDDVWAAGEYFDGAYHGLSLHWDGSSWTQVPIPGGVADLYAFAGDDVYAVGGGVFHWDGATWTTVETLPAVSSPSLQGLDAAGPCELWAGGRQFTDGMQTTLTVHLVPGSPNVPGDIDGDGDMDLSDYAVFANCMAGPYQMPAPPLPTTADECATAFDFDADGDVDVGDAAELTRVFSAP